MVSTYLYVPRGLYAEHCHDYTVYTLHLLPCPLSTTPLSGTTEVKSTVTTVGHGHWTATPCNQLIQHGPFVGNKCTVKNNKAKISQAVLDIIATKILETLLLKIENYVSVDATVSKKI